MQNNNITTKQAVRDDTQDKTPAASEPADKLKSVEDLAVEELADYYANSKPPGRRYPVRMAANMLDNFIDGVAGNPPVNNTDFSVSKRKAYASSSSSAPAKGRAMKLLNIGSTPDGPFTKSSSVPPIKPIGSGFSSPSCQALLKDGPAFSTETDSNIAETRFVRFGLIPAARLQEGTLQEDLEGTDLVGLIESCVYAADDTHGCFALYCRVDDLRAAAASKTMFESALTTVSFTFVDHHEYFGHDHTNARA
ncbi:hypothetical protein KCU77_g137, partial [Aureobasidium melanogenum]